MKDSLLAGIGIFLLLTSSLAQAQALSIDHQPVGCAAAEKFPRLEARFAPADTVAVARVVFQGQTNDWYSVAMKPEGAVFAGVLPKPKKSLKSFRYYIEVTDKALGTNRTAEFTATVVDSSGACQGKILAGALGSASVILQGPAGVAALPAGFASSGVIAGSAAGSSAGAAGASVAGGGGGLGGTALVVGGLALAGGAVAVGAAKGGGEDTSSSTPSGATGSGNTGSIYSVSFLPQPRGIDMSACAGRPLTWSSQALPVDAAGNFNTTWAPNEPNTARISGQLTPTNFQATIACVNGALSGTISATGSNNSYSGTFAFGASTGQVSITKQ
jgi:hypothetical protein